MRLNNACARRAACIAFGIGTIIAATAIPAAAAAPVNDTYADRVVLGTPSSTTVDTSEATSDAIDAELNASCGAPATDASVWYEVTATTDRGMVIDVSGSSYSAGALVVTGEPGAWTLVGCAPGGFAWGTVAGATYTILVFDDQSDGVGNGGTARINVDVIPPPPSLEITVNPRAQFTRAGEAIVSGTVTCDGPAFNTWADTTLSQRIGRIFIRGTNTFQMICDGTAQPWSTTIFPYEGKFAGGKAASVTFGFVCGAFECGYDYTERTVQLSRAT
jgi:hypothetical protein